MKEILSFSERSIAGLDECSKNKTLIAGVYCIYAPGELVRAAGAVPVGLCGKKQDPVQAAEQDLPPSFCPLIKSSYGYAVTDTCPFFRYADVLLAESTCDGKKKMYELMAALKPLHVMQLPHTQSGPSPLAYWLHALRALEDFLVAHGGRPVDPDELHRQIVLHNAMRREMDQVLFLGGDPRSPLSGLDLLALQESKGFAVDLSAHIDLMRRLRAELARCLEEPGQKAHPGPRLMLTGCPVGKGSEKVVRIVEELGARVVCMENCTGQKGLEPVDETGDPYEALARRYLRIPCSCMSPNPGRRESLAGMGRRYGVHGVLDMTWMGCHTYNAESRQVRQWIEEDLGLPMLHLETDYSQSDAEQLRTRIEAYLESLDV